MAGRPPVPTALKILRGNPGKRPLPAREPKPAIPLEVPPCPEWLGGESRAFWEAEAPIHHRIGTLTEADIPAFAAMASAWGTWRATGAVDLLRVWIQLAAGFGMTPSSRARVQAAAPTKPASRWAGLLTQKPGS